MSLVQQVSARRLTISSAAGLAEPTFSTGPANGFGGGSTPSSFQADKPSDIESFLHGNVHVLVGLGGGFMSGFRTAAQDPVFWLHHANIDRLWASGRRHVVTPTRAVGGARSRGRSSRPPDRS